MTAPSYFELRTPRDLLNKARREHSRLIAKLDIDNVFNFFITAGHIRDYLIKTNALPKSIVDAFCNGPDIQYCRDLCDKGKHLILTYRPDPFTDMHFGNAIPGMAIPGDAIPGSSGQWVLRSQNANVGVIELAERVLTIWEDFFEKHRL